MAESKKGKVLVEIVLTDGYEQRFTAAVLKIYSNRKKAESLLKDKGQEAS